MILVKMSANKYFYVKLRARNFSNNTQNDVFLNHENYPKPN